MLLLLVIQETSSFSYRPSAKLEIQAHMPMYQSLRGNFHSAYLLDSLAQTYDTPAARWTTNRTKSRISFSTPLAPVRYDLFALFRGGTFLLTFDLTRSRPGSRHKVSSA